MACTHNDGSTRMFCQTCGKVKDRDELRSVANRILGFVGAQHSTSPKLEKFWQTGDPSEV